MKKNKRALFGIGAVVLMILIAATPAVYGDQHAVRVYGEHHESVPSQGGHESAPDPDEPPQPNLIQQIDTILVAHETFLATVDQEIQAYIDQYGDLEYYVFDQNDQEQLESIYTELLSLVDPSGPPGDWAGYSGWGRERIEYESNILWLYTLWIPHKWTAAFAYVVDVVDLSFALWLGVMYGLGQFDIVSIKILYGFSIYLRSLYTGSSVLLIESRYDQDPTNDDGVKVIFYNWIWPCRFIADDVDIYAQTYGDVPPHAWGSNSFPYPA
jgi:hypothetical protein